MAPNERSSVVHIAKEDDSDLQASSYTTKSDSGPPTTRLQADRNNTAPERYGKQQNERSVHHDEKPTQSSHDMGRHSAPSDLTQTKSLHCRTNSSSRNVEVGKSSFEPQSRADADTSVKSGTCTDAKMALFCRADSTLHVEAVKSSAEQNRAEVDASDKYDAEAKVSKVQVCISSLEARCEAHDGVEVRCTLPSEDNAAYEVDCQNSDASFSALMIACQKGDADAVKALIEKEVDVNTREDAGGRTVLHFCNDEDIVRLLIDAGADVNAKSQDQTTALHSASHRGSVEVAKLLLDCGADVNATDADDVTPLHVASEYGHGDVVRLLLRHGGDVKAKTNRLDTPLHLACFFGRVQVVSELLKEGAEVFAQNLRGWTSVRSARINGQTAVENLLIHTVTKCAYLTCMRSSAKLRHFARAPAC